MSIYRHRDRSTAKCWSKPIRSGSACPEVLVRKGVYAWMRPASTIPGIELSGTVVEQGRDVAQPAIGQPVFGTRRSAQELLESGNVIGKPLLKP
jgi:NADPH:quinone reductase-like Zn-dependent oxidoreductase